MNFLFAIIDSIVEWIKRNPLTCILLVMIAVFAPGLYGAIFIGIGIVVLLLLAIPIIGIFKLRRMSRKIEDEARQQQGFGGFSGQNRTRTNNEGEVKVYTTEEATEKRVNDKVGEYVDFEEVKNK
ncbi:MAG: DUF4834 family protein [Alistipes sp.]|nr:DUF4834 family protein [Alistipes sp.]